MDMCSPLLFVVKEQPSVLEDHTDGQGVLSFCYVGTKKSSQRRLLLKYP